MNTKDSYTRFRLWTRRHYGILFVATSAVTLLIAGFSSLNNYIESRIRSHRMAEIERKLEKFEAEEEAKTVSNMSLQNDIREIKGYIRGVSDKRLKEVVEQNLLKYEEK